LGNLAALPEKELVARMEQDGRRLRQLARGEHPHLFQPVEPPFTLDERMEMDAPVDLLDSLLFIANLMVEQLVLRAKARILALASLTITLTLDGGGSHIRTVRPVLPTTDKQLLIKLLHLDLQAHPPSASILAVALHAEPGSTSKIQLGLFSPQLPEASRLDVTLAAFEPSSAKTMSAAMCFRTLTCWKTSAWSHSAYLPANPPQPLPCRCEPRRAFFVHWKPLPSHCRIRDRQSSSFVSGVIPSNPPTGRGLLAVTGGRRRYGAASNGIS
jgi:hypothetical protein